MFKASINFDITLVYTPCNDCNWNDRDGRRTLIESEKRGLEVMGGNHLPVTANSLAHNCIVCRPPLV